MDTIIMILRHVFLRKTIISPLRSQISKHLEQVIIVQEEIHSLYRESHCRHISILA